MHMATAVFRALGGWRLAGRQLHILVSSLSGAVACTFFSPTFILSPPIQSLPCVRCVHGRHNARKLSTGSFNASRDKDGRVNLTFIDRDGDIQVVRGRIGDNLLEVAREYDIDLEGACDGTLSCSTCHLVVDPEWFPKITDPITEEEDDMLDLAYGLTDTSRLGCQVVVTEDLDGLKLTIPMATLDARET